MNQTKSIGSPRSIRAAGVLALLFGILGVLFGLAAAGTFIPYRQGEPWDEFAEVMTVIAAVGAAVSVLGLLSGWGLRRTRGWAWGVAVGVAGACVVLVAVLAAFAPFFWGFLAIVAVAYGAEVALLLLGRGSYRGRTAVTRAA